MLFQRCIPFVNHPRLRFRVLEGEGAIPTARSFVSHPKGNCREGAISTVHGALENRFRGRRCHSLRCVPFVSHLRVTFRGGKCQSNRQPKVKLRQRGRLHTFCEPPENLEEEGARPTAHTFSEPPECFLGAEGAVPTVLTFCEPPEGNI